jgi:hypothetical protein
MHGERISEVEITHVSSHGVWLLAHGHELFMAYEDFPWFKDAPIGHVLNVEEPSSGHFRWPDLDVDISQASIEDPKKFPLKSIK